ncbi:hypothetical protein [Pirellulimonas nuda]|nr:hypothetical protein [Pirellulimonas nuda]
MALIALGVVLVGASFLLPMMSSPRAALDPAEYDELEMLEDKVVALYQQIERVKSRTGQTAKAEEASAGYNLAVEQRDALRAKLESGIEGPKTTASILFYSGLGSLAAGAIAAVVMKREV